MAAGRLPASPRYASKSQRSQFWIIRRQADMMPFLTNNPAEGFLKAVMSSPVVQSLARISIAVVALVSCSPWIGYIAGDTVIHFIFAEHALDGYWFQFNLGLASGGETSPLYMAALMPFAKLLGLSGLPYAVICLGLIGWVLLCLLVYDVARGLGIPPWHSCAAALALALMPGSARNSVLGMENVWLGVLLLGWTWFIIRWDWLS